MKGKRLSVRLGRYTSEEHLKDKNTAALLEDFVVRASAQCYRAVLRGDKQEGNRFKQFMQLTKYCRFGADGARRFQLRKLEGRAVWAMTLRENVSHQVLSLCKLSHKSKLRVSRLVSRTGLLEN
jgi:hypothetical protein